MDENEVEILRQDNIKLRTELAAQQAVCQKLKHEVDYLYGSLQNAEEEVRKFQEELKIREQMLKELKEAKDKEISNLKQIKRDLEQRLADDSEDSSGCPEAHPVRLPNLSASQIVNALSEWDGMEDTISIFKNLQISESSSSQWKPGSPWDCKWKYSINLYICAPNDAVCVLETFLNEYMATVHEKCTESGCFITPIHVNLKTLTDKGLQPDVTQQFSTCQVQQSDIFVAILKDELDILTKSEVENGYLNNPSAKNAIFLFLPQCESESSDCQNLKMCKLKERIKKGGGAESSNIIECGHNFELGIEELKNRIIQVLNEKFAMLSPIESDNSSSLFERISLLEDMKMEWEQRCIYESLVMDMHPLVAVTEVFDKLDEYVNDESPVTTACLLTGYSGTGKSTLLANWVKRRIDCTDDIVLYHFVKYLCSSSAEITSFYRRLLQQIQYHCKEYTSLPKRPAQLMDIFITWLENLSLSLPKKFILVIDNLDLMTDCEIYTKWILKQLPSGIRIIVTSSEDNYPDSWRSAFLTSPSITTLNISDAGNLVDGIQKHMNVDFLSDDQVTSLGLCAQSSPLWCVLATKHVLCLIKDTSNMDIIDDMIDSYEECEGFVELLKHIFDDLEATYSKITIHMYKILQLIYWSRNGLSVNEIQQNLNVSSCEILFILTIFVRRNMISSAAGIYYIPNVQIQEALQVLLCKESMCDYLLYWTEPLIDIFSDDKSLFSRRVEELLWLLKRAEFKEKLYNALLNTDIFIYLYASCRIGEFISYWLYLHPSESIIANQYCKQLKDIEKDQFTSKESDLVYLYGTVGKIFIGLGYFEEALPILQYSLELCESYCTPDSIEIAHIMVDLGNLHYLTGRYIGAEEYYTEALCVLEKIYNEDSPHLIQILEDLKQIMLKQEKQQLADVISARIFYIKQQVSTTPNASNALMSRCTELESMLSGHDFLGPVDQAGKINELAVIIATYGDFEYAEKKMMEALSVLEECEDDSKIVILKNLGKLYIQNNMLELATALFEKAYEIVHESKYQDKHQKFQVTEKLAFLYRNQGMMRSTEPLQRELLQYLIEEHGHHHLSVAKALNNLAVLYCHLGDFTEALPVFEEAIELYKLNLGEFHPVVSGALSNMRLAKDKITTNAKL